MSERRVHPRIPVCLEFDCRRFYDANGALKQFMKNEVFRVEDLSAGGLQAVSEAFVPAGGVLSFTLYLERVPYVIMGRVRWVRPVEERWQYGIEFLSIPNMLYNHLKGVVERGFCQDYGDA